MLFFGKHAAEQADKKAEEAVRIKASTTNKINKASDSVNNLHSLLKANGITLRIHIATGGDLRDHHGH